jgi:hypothetical protein
MAPGLASLISLGKFQFLRIVPVKYVLSVSNLLDKIRDVKQNVTKDVRASRILLIISLPRGYLVFRRLALGHTVFLYMERNE